MVTLKINNKKIKANEGSTILEVARANGIHIPTLCSNDALESYGACRLCIVEVTQGKELLLKAPVHILRQKVRILRLTAPGLLQAEKWLSNFFSHAVRM